VKRKNKKVMYSKEVDERRMVENSEEKKKTQG
jgi:hypothetical protein